MIRAVVVDDEALARQYLAQLLGAEPDVTVVAECGDVESALDAIHQHRPDLVLLDVQLRRGIAFEALERLGPDELPLVVFVTAFDEYAVRAFEVHALDYLLKPFDAPRLRVALDRVRERLSDGTAERTRLARAIEALRLESAPRYLDRVLLVEDGRTFFLPVASIEVIEARHNHVILRAGTSEHQLRESLSSFERRLDPWRFVRIHRSTIVNIEHVAQIQPWFRGDAVVIMRGGRQLRVGRSYRDVWSRWKGPKPDR